MYICVWTQYSKRKKNGEIWLCCNFQRKKKIKVKKKKRMNPVIWGLPHWKERKADMLSGKQADITPEWFLQFLSLSALLCIFWIYIDSN